MYNSELALCSISFDKSVTNYTVKAVDSNDENEREEEKTYVVRRAIAAKIINGKRYTKSYWCFDQNHKVVELNTPSSNYARECFFYPEQEWAENCEN